MSSSKDQGRSSKPVAGNKSLKKIRSEVQGALENAGRFIVFDGPDGAGKSTQIQLLAETLEKRGIHVRMLREPGGTSAGEVIRSLLLERREEKLTPITEALLFQAARAQLVFEVIRPALQRGDWVVCDRFTLSTLIYQGVAGGMDPKAIEQLSKIATDGLTPDLYLVLLLDKKTAEQRRIDRPADRMESKGDRFMEAVAAAYRKAVKNSRGQLKAVDASGSIGEVRQKIWDQVSSLLPDS